MEQDHITATEPSKPAGELVWSGQRLREAREALDLSQQDVAQHLHLNVNLIQALEDNNEDVLPAQIYLVGYLRSYARLLDLSADSIIGSSQIEQHHFRHLFANESEETRASALRVPVPANSLGPTSRI